MKAFRLGRQRSGAGLDGLNGFGYGMVGGNMDWASRG